MQNDLQSFYSLWIQYGICIFVNMQASELLYFQELKKELEKAFRLDHPACDTPIQEWKGQEISDFQEDLEQKVKGRISEKWFYTHIKKENQARLPRIDMLNLLSAYAGYENWQDFQHRKAGLKKDTAQTPVKHLPYALWAILGIGIFCMGFWAISPKKETCSFCIIDETTREPVESLKIFLLDADESPRTYRADTKGCIKLSCKADQLRFVVSAPYYQSDTILRMCESLEKREEIGLRSDDYAMMIHFFSRNKEEDWLRRRRQLGEIFAEQARIFQVSPDREIGMEMYNKEEFINKMTSPIRSLGQIEILETQYEEGKIVSLRFIQKEEK
ncbi:MAG: hypothetical protein AAF696_35425 [Bacteroidota bacterium]